MNKKVEQVKSRVTDCGGTEGYVLKKGVGLIMLAVLVGERN